MALSLKRECKMFLKFGFEFLSSLLQAAFTPTLSAMWAQAARNVRLAHLFRLIKHQENYHKIASHVLRVSNGVNRIFIIALLSGLMKNIIPVT